MRGQMWLFVEHEGYSLSVFAKAVSPWGEAGSRPGAVAAS